MSDQQRGGAHRVKPTEPGVGAAMCHSGISLVQIDENWSDFNSGDNSDYIQISAVFCLKRSRGR